MAVIKLDGRMYVLTDPKQLSRSNANQVAAKIGSGAGDYDDLQDWNAWLQSDWRAGVGKKDPEAGGSLFATVDTRFGEHFALPQHTGLSVGSVFNARSPAYDAALLAPVPGTTITIGDGQTYTKLAVPIRMDAGETLNRVEVWLPGQDDCEAVLAELWSSTGAPAISSPDTMLQQQSFELNGSIGRFWYAPNFISNLAPTEETEYWLVLYPTTGTLTVPTNETLDYGGGNHDHAGYNGTSWVIGTYSFLARYHLNAMTERINKIARGSYLAAGNGLFVMTSDGAEQISDFDSDITDLLALGDRLYIGLGDTTPYATMDAAYTITNAAVPGRLFAMHNGYLYRSFGQSVSYTSDEVAWTDILVADRGYYIRGMAGMNGELFISTDNQLLRLATGDIVLSVTPWGNVSASNGAFMLNYQGQLYISLGESMVKFDGDALLPFGIDLDEGLPDEFAGEIVGMAANNSWLLIALNGPTPSVWAHNGQGWHFGARLPDNVELSALGFSSQSNLVSTFAAGCVDGRLYSVQVSETKKALSRVATADSGVHFEFFGWLETDVFHGNLREVDKDFESVYIDGENISASSPVVVYWQDDDSTDWELLGTVTMPCQELRWTDPDTRPNSRRIRVGIAMYNSQQRTTPMVTAIRLKYMPMIRDRWRWSVPVMVSNFPETPTGRIWQEVDSQLQHLDSLTKQVPPLIFEDLDGKQFEVKVMNANRGVAMYEWLAAEGRTEIKYVYSLVLEQVTAEEYFAAV